jgi:tetratricopeptide (TPR) repeat protein
MEVRWMLSRLIPLATLSIATAGATLAAQIPTASRPLNANAPGLMVATPFTTLAEDSLTAVEAGHGLRERLTRHMTRDWRVVPRKAMNDALATYGYPADALLDFHAARTLAQQVTAPLMVMPRWQSAGGGRHRLVARLIATGASRGAAGHVVSVEQAAGQDPEDVGEKTADALRPLIRAYSDAAECYDNAASNRSRAISAAEKASRAVANFGPAEYCLGAIAQLGDSTSEVALRHYTNAVQGDPQSIPAYAQIASIHFRRGDSAEVISTYQTMLEVDPLDQTLRENAFKIFQAFGRPSAAEEVADAGIARDPANTDWYDLKSNACLQQEKFDCAVVELERLFDVDSTRADTAFYSKINYAARLAEDTTAYLKWAVNGVTKYPDHQGMLEDAARAYGWVGDAENTIAVTRRLLVIDPGNTEFVTSAVVRLGEAGRAQEAIEFLPMVRESGDPDLQLNFASVMVNAAQRAAQAENRALADTLAQAALDSGTEDPRIVPAANYFIAIHLAAQIQAMSTEVRAESRTCGQVQEYQRVLERAKPALEAAQATTNEGIKQFVDGFIGPVNQELVFVRQLLPTVCR